MSHKLIVLLAFFCLRKFLIIPHHLYEERVNYGWSIYICWFLFFLRLSLTIIWTNIAGINYDQIKSFLHFLYCRRFYLFLFMIGKLSYYYYCVSVVCMLFNVCPYEEISTFVRISVKRQWENRNRLYCILPAVEQQYNNIWNKNVLILTW